MTIQSTENRNDKDRKHVTIYTDGACLGNPGPGGWSAILLYKEKEREMTGGIENTTNNRMELTAVIEALKALKEPCTADVYSDSLYVVDAFRKRWIDGWERKGWKKADNKPVKNDDLWKTLLELTRLHKVNFHYVEGHSGHHFNERCDTLAQKTAEGYSNNDEVLDHSR